MVVASATDYRSTFHASTTKERIKLSEMEVAGQLYQIRKLKVEEGANYIKCKNMKVSHHHEPDLQYKWKSKHI